MRNRLSLAVLLPLVLAACHTPAGARSAAPMLAHDVYFTLREDSPARRAALIDSCREHLAPIEGIVRFAAGERDEGLVRDVNDKDFDVALQIVFRDRAAHDRYQADARHLRFIEENKANWEKVRVFDALVRPR